MTGPWDTRELVRHLIERLRHDGWLAPAGVFVSIGEDDVSEALTRALDAALANRKASGVSPPRVAAENFLRDTVINKDVPLAERMHAAALLLQVKP